MVKYVYLDGQLDLYSKLVLVENFTNFFRPSLILYYVIISLLGSVQLVLDQLVLVQLVLNQLVVD